MENFLNDISAEFVGSRLEVFQKALEIRPSQFENQFGWGQQKWGRWKNGECIPEVSDMIPFSELYNVTLDYIYRGDMSNLPDWMSEKIRVVVAQDPRFVMPHPIRSSRVRLISRWETDQDHRLRGYTVMGGLQRDQYGFGVGLPYSPLGRTRWELANANPDTPFWKAHIAALEKREAFKNFSFNLKTRSGRWVRLTTSGQPHFENRRFLGYRGAGRFFSFSNEFVRAA